METITAVVDNTPGRGCWFTPECVADLVGQTPVLNLTPGFDMPLGRATVLSARHEPDINAVVLVLRPASDAARSKFNATRGHRSGAGFTVPQDSPTRQVDGYDAVDRVELRSIWPDYAMTHAARGVAPDLDAMPEVGPREEVQA